MERLLAACDLSGVVSVSGKLPAGAPEDACSRIARMVRKAGGRLVLDVQGSPLLSALEYRPALVKMNDHELALTLPETAGGVEAGAEELLRRGAGAVLITCGAEPAFARDADIAFRLHPPKIRALNPVGSGDASTAGLMLEWAKGNPFPEALKTAMACGAANALNLHCGLVRPQDVSELRLRVRLEVV